MRQWISLSAVLCALALLFGGSAWAGEKSGKPDRDGWIKEVGLSPEQMAKIDGIRKEHRELTKKIRAEREALVKDIAKLVKEKAADADLQGKLDAVHGLKKQIGEAMDKYMQNLRAVLTPVQQAKLVLWMDKNRGSKGQPAPDED